MNNVALLGLASIALLVSPGAGADVYKCEGSRGVPVYQEMPCDKGKELRNFQTDPPEITVLPAEPRSATIPAAKPAPPEPKVQRDTKPGKSALAGDAAERKHLRTGMGEAEVLTKLGQPDMTTGSKNSTVVRWIYLPAAGDPETITSVTLTKGLVTDIERKVSRK